MRSRIALITSLAAILVSGCSHDSGITDPIDPNPLPTSVLLKDIVDSNLPSPFYHFVYDTTGKVTHVSYASDLVLFDVKYQGDRIVELDNTLIANFDRLVYVYNSAGRVDLVKYLDRNGQVFTMVELSYTAGRLTGMERSQRVNGGFIIDKTLSFSYYPNGNVYEVTEHRPAIDSVQDETTGADRYEEYDDKTNVDGFSLTQTEFFDYLFLIPGIHLQKNNPTRVRRMGDGTTYTVDYTYTYDGNRPLLRSGSVQILTGPSAGQTFQITRQYSYY